MMISMLRYKAERAGGWFAVIDARNTSQECSQCGRTVQKDLSVRIHRCAHCKMEVHPTQLEKRVGETKRKNTRRCVTSRKHGTK